MCTASWNVEENGYRLIFNRDEQVTRPRAFPPRLLERDGVALIAPIDPRSDGSWIAVNEWGLCAFLLNNYAGSHDIRVTTGKHSSRGEIPLRLAAQKGYAEALAVLSRLGQDGYRPFFAGILAPGRAAAVFDWNGREFREETVDLPFLTTSSYRTDEVQSYRRNRFADWRRQMGGKPDIERWLQFHCDTSNKDPAFNPFMSRDDAETHCLSMVSVDNGEIVFEYRERSDAGGFGQPKRVSMMRRSDRLESRRR